ncbi:hypothetical protein SAMN02745136_02411 [Anaerocolumna jejuensis DSM 15929]|uniref:Uncharacterized protein n=1 Tax=Anaerocolumna jejuensis DSM 15929 TaxID=1121322 RepID=A0A1M6S5D2_9FIRM|nr:hypothetical protein SAMN02745136_02411 [Anaerocolumna jejuensis DSM 15929]
MMQYRKDLFFGLFKYLFCRYWKDLLYNLTYLERSDNFFIDYTTDGSGINHMKYNNKSRPSGREPGLPALLLYKGV